MSPKAIGDIEGYRFSFFSNEGSEPPHVHVYKGNGSAKFWISPLGISLEECYGFKKQELKRASQLVLENKEEILKQWYLRKGK